MRADELVAILGLEAATELSCKFGGKRVYLHKEPLSESPIAQAVGIESQAMLSACLNCGGLYIPASLAKKRKINEILRLSHMGLRSGPISLQTGVPARTVRHIRAMHI